MFICGLYICFPYILRCGLRYLPCRISLSVTWHALELEQITQIHHTWPPPEKKQRQTCRTCKVLKTMCSLQCFKQVKQQPTAILLLLNFHRKKRFAIQCRRHSEKAIRVTTGIYPMNIQLISKILYFLAPRHPDTSWEDIRTPPNIPKIPCSGGIWMSI